MKLKQEETVELVKFLGLDEVESLDAAKEKFTASWTKQEDLTAAVGKITGTLTNAAKKAFDFAGVTLAEDEIKGKKAEDVIRIGAEKAKSVYEEKLRELETLKSGSGTDELMKKVEKEKEQLSKQLKEKDTLLTDLSTQFESFKTDVIQKEKKGKIQGTFENSLKEIKLDPATSQYTLRGFKESINDKYIIDLEEDDSVVVKDKKTGEKIPNKSKAGTFMDLKAVLEKEATEANIILKNPHNGKPAPTKGGAAGSQNANADNQRAKGVNPRFLGQ